MEKNIFIEYGGDFTLNIHVPPIDEHTIQDPDFDFTTEVYCIKNDNIKISPVSQCIISEQELTPKITLAKSQVNIINDKNYAINLKTEDLGLGRIIIRILAKVPDEGFETGYRREPKTIITRMHIVKYI